MKQEQKPNWPVCQKKYTIVTRKQLAEIKKKMKTVVRKSVVAACLFPMLALGQLRADFGLGAGNFQLSKYDWAKDRFIESETGFKGAGSIGVSWVGKVWKLPLFGSGAVRAGMDGGAGVLYGVSAGLALGYPGNIWVIPYAGAGGLFFRQNQSHPMNRTGMNGGLRVEIKTGVDRLRVYNDIQYSCRNLVYVIGLSTEL